MGSEEENGVFYLRYHIGHKGKHGHEFLEFEFTDNGKLRYANNSNYKNDTIIRKEVYVSPAVIHECRRMVSDSEVIEFMLTILTNIESFDFSPLFFCC